MKEVFIINHSDSTISATASCEMFREYPDVMTVKQVQAALQIGRTWVYKLLDSGELDSFKIGRNIRITKENLIRYVRKENL